jgi:hypothetical protein
MLLADLRRIVEQPHDRHTNVMEGEQGRPTSQLTHFPPRVGSTLPPPLRRGFFQSLPGTFVAVMRCLRATRAARHPIRSARPPTP